MTYRDEALAEAVKKYDEDETQLRERFLNPYGYHEVLHLSHVIRELVDERLAGHPCVIFDEEAFALASEAGDKLHDLYQRIGKLQHESESKL